ncbi:MAG: carbohydrate kinase family protein [Eubacteriaceae bacterium]|jgi:fructokinase
MTTKTDVTALGELLIDFTENGTSAQGNPLFEANPGGAPCNVLAMLTSLGDKTAFIGKVGDDNFGHMLADRVAGLGINTDNLKFDTQIPTTLAFVHKRPNGDRDFAFYRKPGADVRLTADEIDLDGIRNSRDFHFGTLSMTDPEIREATELAVKTAKEAGLLVSFDPNLRPPLWDDLEDAREAIDWGLHQADIVKISDEEVLFMTGKDEIPEAVQAFKAMYDIPLAAVTLGPDGSIALYKGMEVTGRPFINPDTIETTGAGDTFCANMIHTVLQTGLDNFDEAGLKAMLEYANAAASLITSRKGALSVMPTPPEIDAFMAVCLD